MLMWLNDKQTDLAIRKLNKIFFKKNSLSHRSPHLHRRRRRQKAESPNTPIRTASICGENEEGIVYNLIHQCEG